MSTPQPVAVRLFRRLSLLLLPRALWKSHGQATVEAFEDLFQEARTRGMAATSTLLVREFMGLFRVAATARFAHPPRSTGGAFRRGDRAAADAWWFDAWRDVSHSVRALRVQPGHTAVVVATLALGVASTAGVFTVVNGALFRPLPYEEPDRLVQIWSVLQARTDPTETTVSPADFTDWRARARGFSGLGAHNLWFPVLTGGEGDAQRVLAGLVTTNLMDVLGVRPLLGRGFRPDDGAAGRNHVTILSYGLWRSRYGADPGILGSSIVLNDAPYEVVGVMPSNYRHPDPHRPLSETALFVPFDVEPGPSETGRFLRVVGRLGPEVGVREAQAEMDVLSAALQTLRPIRNHDVGASVLPLHEEFYGSKKAGMLMVLGGAGALFLIVCANVANLVLARTLGRRREFAVRASLGAGRRRIAMQLLIENGVLALAGSGLGLLLVVAGMKLIRGVQGRLLPLVADIRVDVAVAAFVAALTAVTTLLLGALPLLELLRTPVHAVLGEESAGAGVSRRAHRVKNALVVAEVTLATALVAGAGLLGRSLRNLTAVHPGFDARKVLTLEFPVPRERYPDVSAERALYAQVRDRLLALPGVERVGYASELPMLDGDWTATFDVVGQGFSPEEYPDFEIRYVSPEYFPAMGIPVLSGREFGTSDRAGAPRVVMVNERLSSRYWTGGEAVGKQLVWSESGVDVRGEIVGVVADVLDAGLSEAPDPFVYFPIDQRSSGSAAFVVRAAGDPLSLTGAARAALREIDPSLAVEAVDSYQNRIAQSIAGSRFASHLAGVFSAVALVLAGLGIYGVLVYSVGARTREIGIRTALGARRREVAGMVVRQGLLLTSIGLALGMSLAMAEGRLLRSFLFGIPAIDPVSFALAGVVLLPVALAASYLPARRALAVEPVEALRGEGR